MRTGNSSRMERTEDYMGTGEPERIADELATVCAGGRLYPFPRADCKKLLEHDNEQYHHLVMHLDFFFTDVVGYCRQGQAILKWPEEKVHEARTRLSRSFFERYPQYAPLEALINETDTPDLFVKLSLHERLRTSLLSLLVKPRK
jgi:hypothetical protein